MIRRGLILFAVFVQCMLIDLLIVIAIPLLVLWACSTVCQGQVYQIDTISQRSTSRGVETIRGRGTAVCIGQRGTTGLFLTAKHNLSGAQTVVVQGDQGTSEAYRTSLHPTEDIAAFCARGMFRPMPMSADEIPSGAPVQVCGYGPAAHGTPNQFCFAASIDGEILTSKSHVIPGDSGGAAYVGLGEENVLVGIVKGYYPVPDSGYSNSRNDGKGRESLIVPISTIAEWLPTQYSNCPSCIPLNQPRPMQERGIIRYRSAPAPRMPPRTAPSPVEPVQPPGNHLPGGCTVVVDYDRVAREVWERYGNQLRGQQGPAGQPGERGPAGRDAEVNYEAIIDAVVRAMPQQDTTQTDSALAAILARIEAIESKEPTAGTVHVIVTDNGKEIFNRPGVPDGSTVRVPITRVER